MRTNAGGAADPQAIAVVNQVSRRAPLRLELEPDGGGSLHEVGVGGVDAALARILAALHSAMADGTWPRLKACLSDDCQFAFYDRSRNRSGHWCDMGVCGSRHKVRAYRARHPRPR